MTMTMEASKMRIGGSKVRSGCVTCKARRIKCDEGRPTCQRCKGSGRACEGYAASSNTKRTEAGHRFVYYVEPTQLVKSTPESILSPFGGLDSSARHSLEFFLHSSALHLEYPFSIGMWSQALACYMHSQNAVRHGLIALAALHENYQETSTSIFTEQRRLVAWDHYGKSIHEIVQLNSRCDGEFLGPTLVVSLLYCTIESLQGHFHSAMKHIVAGLKLLGECQGQSKDLPTGLLDALWKSFISLGMQLMAMEPKNVWPELAHVLRQSRYLTDSHFTTIDQALAEITHLQADTMSVAAWVELSRAQGDVPSAELQKAHQNLRQRFRNWNISHQNLLAQKGLQEGMLNPRIREALLMLRANRHVAKIMLSLMFAVDQMCFDLLVSEFRAIVVAAEEMIDVVSDVSGSIGGARIPTFGMTLGIVPALFFTCVRCRDPDVRRRALYLLKRMRRREGIWDSAVVSPLAEKVILVEEEAARQHRLFVEGSHKNNDMHGTANTALPELTRISKLEVDFLDSEKTAKVSLLSVGLDMHHEVLIWEE